MISLVSAFLLAVSLIRITKHGVIADQEISPRGLAWAISAFILSEGIFAPIISLFDIKTSWRVFLVLSAPVSIATYTFIAYAGSLQWAAVSAIAMGIILTTTGCDSP